MYVVSLADFAPSPRYDETQWLTATIEEAPAEAGPWEDIEGFELAAEVDPSNPTSRSFTSTEAQYQNGWYRIRYEDGEGNQDLTDAVSSSMVPQEIPSLDEVADLMYARTRTPGGALTGRFTDQTTPTAAKVRRFIVRAYSHVSAATGTITNPDLMEDFKTAVMYYTGVLIELGSETINVDRLKELKELYGAAVGGLVEAVGGEGASAVDEVGGNSANQPVFGFPEPGIGVRTLW